MIIFIVGIYFLIKFLITLYKNFSRKKK
jgi:hypothetical protein